MSTAPWELALMLAVADYIRPEISGIIQALRDPTRPKNRSIDDLRL